MLKQIKQDWKEFTKGEKITLIVFVPYLLICTIGLKQFGLGYDFLTFHIPILFLSLIYIMFATLFCGRPSQDKIIKLNSLEVKNEIID